MRRASPWGKGEGRWVVRQVGRKRTVNAHCAHLVPRASAEVLKDRGGDVPVELIGVRKHEELAVDLGGRGGVHRGEEMAASAEHVCDARWARTPISI